MDFGVAVSEGVQRCFVTILDLLQLFGQLSVGLQEFKLPQDRKIREMCLHLGGMKIIQIVQHRPQLVRIENTRMKPFCKNTHTVDIPLLLNRHVIDVTRLDRLAEMPGRIPALFQLIQGNDQPRVQISSLRKSCVGS